MDVPVPHMVGGKSAHVYIPLYNQLESSLQTGWPRRMYGLAALVHSSAPSTVCDGDVNSAAGETMFWCLVCCVSMFSFTSAHQVAENRIMLLGSRNQIVSGCVCIRN